MQLSYRALKVVIVGDHPDCSTRLKKVLEENSENRFCFAQSTDIFVCLKLIEERNPDLIYICSGISDSSMSDFYRWFKGMGIKEHAAVVCHFYDEGDNVGNAYGELDIIIGSDVSDVLVGKLSDIEFKSRIESAIAKRMRHAILLEEKRAFEIASVTDDLTGLKNMRGFNLQFKQLLTNLSKRNIPGLALIMIDLDHFKRINDEHNHLVGSMVIKEVGILLKTIYGDQYFGVEARYGGDEFILAFECCSADQACEIGKKIVEIIRNKTFSTENDELNITASVGVAFTRELEIGNSDSLVKAADVMLFKSKENGRNQSNFVNVEELNEESYLKSGSDRYFDGSEAMEKLKNIA